MKISKKRAKEILTVIAAILCFLIIRELMVTDEQRIKRVIYDGKAAIEQEDLEGVMEQVSRSYKDDYGLTKVSIIPLFQRLFQQFDDIQIRIEEIQITVEEGSTGRVSLQAWGTVSLGDERGYLIGTPEAPCYVVFTLAKEGRKWRVIKTEGIIPEEVYQ